MNRYPWAGLLLGLCMMAPVHAKPTCVLDDTQAPVCVAQAAHRVLSLSPHLTESVAFVHGLNAVVAVDSSSDYPSDVNRLPKLGAPWLLGSETVLAQKPDLVLVWNSGINPAVVERLRALKVPVYVSEPKTLGEVASTLRRLSSLLGTERQSEGAIHAWESGIQQQRTQHQGLAVVPVFYQVWPKPLMTLGGSHVVSEILSLCGGRNVFEDQPGLAFQVSAEAVLARKPGLVLASGDDTRERALIHQWSMWSTLPAVRNGWVQSFPKDILVRNGPRLLEATQRMCALLNRVRQGPAPGRPAP
ncbi:cobalamin-binding protein [Limnobacter humi]|uniref:Cobalamin-binding protein n=1 Tax=Limnobacter humi TaxID=1778671 RepID=A0ABT1WE61_9BURK|nr:cobalamin-binding protein [Limnobacter humi]MCQ8895163.1 cobalamin-binding protein [Limnobacter humi]